MLKDFIRDNELETLINTALTEDIREGDATVEAIIPEEARSSAQLVAKEGGTHCRD